MKTKNYLLTTLVLLIVCQTFTQAAIVNGINWADEVDDWCGNIMNYSSTLMTAETETTVDTTWWLTGAPDSDVDGNGYAWDNGDNDYVAGWRNCGSDPNKVEWFTVKFDTPLKNGEDDDLVLVTYGGSGTQSSVWASIDGEEFFFIEYLYNGTPGEFKEEWFDFSDAIDTGTGNSVTIDEIQYVKICRVTTGPATGRFFDAIGGEVEYIPGDANRDGKVDGSDVTILAGNWQVGVNDSETATWEMGDFNDDGKVDGSDVTILAGNWQAGVTTAASAVPEPQMLIMLLTLTGGFLYWRKK